MRALGALVAMAVTLAGLAAETLPALELPTLAGDRFFRLEEARGRPVVVNFWDVDCPPCRREMPLLNGQAVARPDVAFIGVSLSPRDEARRFLMERPSAYLQLWAPTDPKALLRRLGNGPGGLPYTVVFDAEGRRCATHLGELDASRLAALLARCA